MTRNTYIGIVLASLLAAPAARADGGFSTTNVQFLYGWKFADPLYNAGGGPMQTTTLNNFNAFGWGDSFFFVDLYRANFSKGQTGFPPGRHDDAQIYAEWHPRVFLNQLLGWKSSGIPFVRNWGAAFEINQGSGVSPGNFYAYLAGVGFDFDVPAGYVLGLNIYYRYDRFAYNQYQVSPFWTVPFAIGPVPFVFTGFVDVNGTTTGTGTQAVEIWAQPELLVDVLAPFHGPKNKLYVGTEWFLHRGSAAALGMPGLKNTSVPQIMAQWTMY